MSFQGSFQRTTGTVRLTDTNGEEVTLDQFDLAAIKAIVENQQALRRAFNPAHLEKPQARENKKQCSLVIGTHKAIDIEGSLEDVLKSFTQAGFAMHFDIRDRRRPGLKIALKPGLAASAVESVTLQTPEGPQTFRLKPKAETPAQTSNNGMPTAE